MTARAKRFSTTLVAVLGAAFALAPAVDRAAAGLKPPDAITGSVVTVGGKPVAGADVWLVGQGMPHSDAVTLAKSRTDEQGRFRLVADQSKHNANERRAIWTHKPGLPLAAMSLQDDLSPPGLGPDRPVRLTLGPAVSSTFRVIDLGGGWSVGAKVVLTSIDGIRTSLPTELAERVAARTDRDGRAILHDIPLDLIRGVRITTVSAGIQSFDSVQGFKDQEELVLNPVFPLEGRVMADDSAAVRGVLIHLTTSHPDDARYSLGQGEAHVVTDNQGRFRVTALAKGQLATRVQVPEGSLYRPARISTRELTEDRIKLPVGRVPGLARVDVLLPKPWAETFKLDIQLIRAQGDGRE